MVTSALAAVAAIGAVVWATSGERSDTLRRVQTIESEHDSDSDDSHTALGKRVVVHEVHLTHLRARADKADADRGKIIESVGRLENSATRVEALLESVERRLPLIGPMSREK